jgi:hypothetical protein
MPDERFSLFGLSLFDKASHVAVMQAYFDASEQGDFLVVAGYLFRKKNIKPFERKWRAMCRKHGIEYFHMTDCNAAAREFKSLNKAQRIECQTEAIAAICEFAALGLINSVKITDFNDTKGMAEYMSNPFSLCAHGALMMCKNWAEDNDPKARIAYVFEAGDKFQGDVQNILHSVSENVVRRRFFHYEAHAFHPKRSSMPTQAADILAWNAAKQQHRNTRGIERHRADFDVLLQGVKTMQFFNSISDMQDIIRSCRRNAKFDNSLKIGGLGLRVNRSNQKATIAEIRSLITPAALSHILQGR